MEITDRITKLTGAIVVAILALVITLALMGE
jgi:hypothetical protein